MESLTCSSVCHLFCCPPIPSRIASKLAFMPPPPTYDLRPIVGGPKDKYSFNFTVFHEECFFNVLPRNVEVTKAVTRRGHSIAVIYMALNSSSQITFLVSHGNAVDLGLVLNFLYDLGSKLNVNIMCYDYCGYGASSGKPTEKNICADAECALNLLKTKFGVPLNHTVLYGQSIGTVPTVHLATLHRVAAVVLHSPLMSGLRIAFPRMSKNCCFDVFSNISRAPTILSPTLIIHGTDDSIIHHSHSRRLFELIPNVLEPLFIRGAGHNDCELFEEYFIRLEYLVHVELPSWMTTVNEDANTDRSTSVSKRRFGCFTDQSNSVSQSTLPPSSSHFNIRRNPSPKASSRFESRVNSETRGGAVTVVDPLELNDEDNIKNSQSGENSVSFQSSPSSRLPRHLGDVKVSCSAASVRDV